MDTQQETPQNPDEMIATANRVLAGLGLQNATVFAHQKTARICVPESDYDTALRLREELTQRLRELGFRFVALDLEGKE